MAPKTKDTPATELALREQEQTMALPDARELSRMKEIANALAASNMVPSAYRRKPEDILGAAIAGRELGLSVMSSLQRIRMIEGKPTLSAEAMVALVQRAGHEIWFEHTDATKAVVSGQRRGSDRTHTMAFTIGEARSIPAKENGKWITLADKYNWKAYPAAMLRARAISALCRVAFADVLAGYAYTSEELQAGINEDGSVDGEVIDVEPVDAPTEQQAAPPNPDGLPEWLAVARERFGEQNVIDVSETVRQDLNVGKPITKIEHCTKASGPIRTRILEILERDHAPSDDDIEDAEIVVDHPCPMCGAECMAVAQSDEKRRPKFKCSNDECRGNDAGDGPWCSWHNDPWKIDGQIEKEFGIPSPERGPDNPMDADASVAGTAGPPADASTTGTQPDDDAPPPQDVDDEGAPEAASPAADGPQAASSTTGTRRQRSPRSSAAKPPSDSGQQALVE